jgi:PhoPQ-activated pathogenicity-related protein
MTMSNSFPPLTAKQLKQLRTDAADLRSAEARKNVTFDSWDHVREAEAAQKRFELGCWLFYYSTRIHRPGKNNLADRVDCPRRIFEAGFTRLTYEFYTVFDFGERQFDSKEERMEQKNLPCVAHELQ